MSGFAHCSRRAALGLTLAACLVCSLGCDNGSTPWRVYVRTAIDTQGGSGADGVVVADMDGDGDLDAVSAWEGSDRVRLHLQQPSGTWLNGTIAEGSSVAGVEDVAVGDLDGDGQLDVVAACESGVLSWIRQGLTWTSVVIGASTGAACDSWIDVELGDLNGDGQLEIVAACREGNRVSVFHSADANSDASSFVRLDIDAATRRKASCVRLVDLDLDGDLDIVSAARNETTNSIAWYEDPGLEDAFTLTWAKHAIGHWPDTIWLDVADVDGDGLDDVAVSSWEDASFAWFRQPEHVRDRWDLFVVGQFSDTNGAGITITDLDQNGVTDLVVGTYNDGRLAVFRPLTSVAGIWLPLTLSQPGGRLDLVPVVDLDADGRLDILTTIDADDGGVFWYRPWP